jgi:hypothetical protein
MELVFLKAKQRLAKEISTKGTTPYPLTKNFTSEHIQISKSKKGLHDLLKHLQNTGQPGRLFTQRFIETPIRKRVQGHDGRPCSVDRVINLRH